MASTYIQCNWSVYLGLEGDNYMAANYGGKCAWLLPEYIQ